MLPTGTATTSPRTHRKLARVALSILSVLLVFCMLPIASGCSRSTSQGTSDTSATGSSGNADGSESQAAGASTASAAPASSSARSAEQIMAGMTLEEKVEQMLMLDFRQWNDSSGNPQDLLVLNDDVSAILAKYNFGGVVLFSENCSTTEQTLKLTSAMQASATQNGLPLLIACDQEGGSVVRLANCTTTPGNMALGATGSTANAKAAAKIIGSELSAVGINVDFAPDIDVNTNPSNPAIGIRSFSSDPATVASMGAAFIDGLHEGGVATTVKHFPGHGDAAIDSHTGLPCVNKSLEEIEQTELVPFQSTVASTDIVMTAHIQFPQIETATYKSIASGVGDICLPATLSKTFITDILRNDLGFKGVVATDALDMKAISDNFAPADTARLVISAGADLLVMPIQVRSNNDLSALDAYVADIVQMVQEGAIPQSEIDDSVKRIIQLKIDRGIISSGEASTAKDPDASQIAAAQVQVGSAANHEAERAIADQAITVTANDGLLPLSPATGENVLLLCAYEDEAEDMQFGFKRLVSEGVIDSGTTCTTAVYTKGEGMDGIIASIAEASYVIVDSEITVPSSLDPATSWTSACVDQAIAAARAAGVPICVMSVGIPYDAGRYPEANAMVIAYGARGTTLGDNSLPVGTYGPNIPAALDIIFGEVNPTGVLPVDVPALDGYAYAGTILYPRGYGIIWLS